MKENTKKSINADLEADVKIHHASVNYTKDTDNNSNTNITNSTKASKELIFFEEKTFKPKHRPYIPNNLILYKNKLSWQNIAKRRLETEIVSEKITFSSKENKTIIENNISDISNEINQTIKIGYNNPLVSVNSKNSLSELQSELKKYSSVSKEKEEITIEYEIEYEDKDNLINKEYHTPLKNTDEPFTNKLELNKNEQEYLDYFKDAFNDKVITKSERSFLDRRAKNLNISPDKVNEIERLILNDSDQQPINKEVRYLNEVKAMLADNNGIISEEAKEPLENFKKRLGLSDESANKLEKQAIQEYNKTTVDNSSKKNKNWIKWLVAGIVL
jgi:hypothetical protein